MKTEIGRWSWHNEAKIVASPAVWPCTTGFHTYHNQMEKQTLQPMWVSVQNTCVHLVLFEQYIFCHRCVGSVCACTYTTSGGGSMQRFGRGRLKYTATFSLGWGRVPPLWSFCVCLSPSAWLTVPVLCKSVYFVCDVLCSLRLCYSQLHSNNYNSYL